MLILFCVFVVTCGFMWMMGGYLGCHVCHYVVNQFCAAIWCGVAVAFQILDYTFVCMCHSCVRCLLVKWMYVLCVVFSNFTNFQRFFDARYGSIYVATLGLWLDYPELTVLLRMAERCLAGMYAVFVQWAI